MTPSKRQEMEKEFASRADSLQVSRNPRILFEIGGYNINGLGISEHRERLLETGKPVQYPIVEFPLIDIGNSTDKISVAAD
jgi:hypothetical protein